MNPRLHSCLLFIVLCCSYIDAQERCFNPRNRQGICVNIRNCPQLISILRKPRPLSQEDLDFLRSSQCGFEGDHPKVCCENAAQEPIPTPATPTPTPTPIDDPTRITTIPDPPDVTNHPNLRIINPEGCGHITESKLLGGNKTGVAEFPWMALIAYDVGRANPEFRCGGTAISKRYVLTAAHCITGLSGIKLVGVRLGDHDLRTERDCDKDGDGLETVCAERYQDFGVESSVPHPGYTKSVLHDDVGLIRLNADADFRPINVRPICLPVGGAAGAQLKRVTVTGWGATETGRRSPDLLKINISPVPNEQCAQNYKRSRVNIWHKQLCAGGTKDVDSCQGDSGGPLQSPGSQNGNLRWIQYGIVSFGPKDCGIEGFPGVYTRVSYYLDWMLDNMRD